MNEFITNLKNVVTPKNVITEPRKTERFRTAYRAGIGEALCVVKPSKLLEFWHVLQLCVKFDKIIIVQAANTGLTQGSTPIGPYDRDVVIINTLKMSKIFLLNNANNVLCLPGCSLSDLEQKLKPFGRLPHSVLGSSCFGASVVGGVCNNSGGALVHRGPAYTELALFAKINKKGKLELVNHLGIELGDNPIEIIKKLDNEIPDSLVNIPRNASHKNTNYEQIVRDVNANTPARFNANPVCLKDASGCAGKVAVFAVCMDTFPASDRQKTFYIGTNNPDQLRILRKKILEDFNSLPVIGEYMSRPTVEISEKYGKDLSLVIRFFGSKAINQLFSLKLTVDKFLSSLLKKDIFSDRFLQFICDLIPCILPKRIQSFKEKNPRVPLPDSVQWVADRTDVYNRNHWLRIDSRAEFGSPAVVAATKDSNRIVLDTVGVDALTLLISPDQFDFERPLEVIADGEQIFEGELMLDKSVMLDWAAIDLDRSMLFAHELRLKIQSR